MDCGAVFCQHCLVGVNPSPCFDLLCLKIIRKFSSVDHWTYLIPLDQWIIWLLKMRCGLWIIDQNFYHEKMSSQKMNNCYSTFADISSKLPLQWVGYTALKIKDLRDPCDQSVPHVVFVYFFLRNSLKMCIIIR